MPLSVDTHVGPAPLPEAAALVPPGGDLGDVLGAVAAAVAHAAGFGTVAINLYRPEWDDYEVVAVHGHDAAREALLGATYPSRHWDHVLREQDLRNGAYLLPAGAFDWNEAPSFVPDLPPADGERAWHAEDALFAPMHGPDGHLLGVISVDEPLSGLRPQAEELRALVALAAHAALAIQAAQAADAARRHQSALAQLLRVSAKLNGGESVDAVLQTVCDAIHEALGFNLVVVETPDEAADRYRPCAAAGYGYDPAVLQIEVPLSQLRRVYDPAFEIEGCYLLPRDEALARVGGEPLTYASSMNGRGPRGWNRHWLIVPLFDASGRELGFIWADDPTDRLLPSRDRLQALRLFADTAQRALVAAEQLDALREAGERQAALVKHSPTGIVLLGRDAIVRDWNDAARALFGYADEDVIGKLPPWILDTEGFPGRFTSFVESGGIDSSEFTDIHADGRLLRVRTTAAPLRDSSGTVTGVIVTITDVTEERQTQQELERQKSEVEALYDTTLALVDRLDLEDVLHTIVTRASDLVAGDGGYLYLVDEETGTAVPAVATGMFAELITRPIARDEGLAGLVWRTGETHVIDDYSAWPSRLDIFRDLDYHAVAGVPIRDGDRVAGIIGVGLVEPDRTFTEAESALLSRFSHLASLALAKARLYDKARHEVEERRRAERRLEHQNEELARLYEALRKSEEMYRKVVDNTADLITVFDPDGRLVFASPSHETVLGYDVEKLIGESGTPFVHPDDVSLFVRSLSGEESVEGTVRLRHCDGSWRRVAGRSTAIADDSGSLELVLWVSRDVTERDRLEEQLRQSQKMEAIGRLAGGVAHDFNNLLTAIGGYAELASGQLPEPSPAQRSLGEIRRAADRAAELTRQLLAYSRKQVLQPKVVDVNDVVRGMRGILARLVGTHIELETALADDVGRTRVDPSQLEQVVMNLVINARDSMPTGGRLVVRTGAVELDGDDYVLLSVADTGHGMTPETLQLAFEPFFTTKPPGEGTGLGLSTVYGIVTQTGGRVDAESTPGEGTTMRVFLPRVTDAADIRPRPAGEERSPGSGTVLLVEDEELVRDLVRELLQAGGYTVIDAPDGHRALELAAAHPGRIDVLVTDVVMPGLSGQQVAARLLARHAGLRVLFTSGYAEHAIQTHGELTPGAAFLGKPFSARELAAKLSELLERV